MFEDEDLSANEDDIYDQDELDNDSESEIEESYSDESAEDDGVPDSATDPAELSLAELQIQGDFDRLVGTIRSSGDVSSAAALLSRVWDALDGEGEEETNIDTSMEAFHDQLRAASGIGRVGRAFNPKAKAGADAHTRRPRRPRTLKLSPEARHLLGEANQAFIDSNLPLTISLTHRLIAIEPRLPAAWSVLSAAYSDPSINQPLKALQVRIIGAHLNGDVEEWETLATLSEKEGLWRQAGYCWGKVVKIDAGNVGAMWERARVARELGELNLAKSSLLSILQYHPHDMNVLSSLREVLVSLSSVPSTTATPAIPNPNLKLCHDLYAAAFEAYLEKFSTGSAIPGSNPGSSSDPQDTDTNPFTYHALLCLADLQNALGLYEYTIHTIRRGTRWLEGRLDERWWDACVDDREYDTADTVRDSTAGGDFGGGSDGERRQWKAGKHSLDLNARHRLAIARLKLGEPEGEGKRHASIILAESPLEYAELFSELGETFFELGMFEDARNVFEVLGADGETSSVHILMRVAACRRNLGELAEAAEVYEHILASDLSNNDAKLQLAEIYEILGQARRALDLVYQVIDSRRRNKLNTGGTADDAMEVELGSSELASTSLFEESHPTSSSRKFRQSKSSKSAGGKSSGSAVGVGNRAGRLSKSEIEALEKQKDEEVRRGWTRVRELWKVACHWDKNEDIGINDDRDTEVVLDKETKIREWMYEAEKLVEGFRETRGLFLSSYSSSVRLKHLVANSRKASKGRTNEDVELVMAERLQLDLERDATGSSKETWAKTKRSFRGVTFEKWLELIIQYSFMLTRRNQFDVAEEVLTHILVSNPYQDRRAQDAIRLALITCAIHASPSPHKPSTPNDVIVTQARKLISAYQFNNEPYRILLSSLASGIAQQDAFAGGPFQKQLVRELRLTNDLLDGEEIIWNAHTRRYTRIGKGGSGKGKGKEVDEDDDEEMERAKEDGDSEIRDDLLGRFVIPEKPTKRNPLIMATYGMACCSNKTYQSALFYLLPARDCCPVDPLINLSLAISSIGRSMQRQADNRNYLIVQAMGFLTHYREHRMAQVPDGEERFYEEIEYNYGRTFHQLGLFTYALRHYNRVLAHVEKRLENGDSDLGLARETAHNLSLIYIVTGSSDLAEELYRKWLSI